jgi:hypothetical protein
MDGEQTNPGDGMPLLNVADILRQLAHFSQNVQSVGESSQAEPDVSCPTGSTSQPMVPPLQTYGQPVDQSKSKVHDHLRELQRITAAARSSDPRRRPPAVAAATRSSHAFGHPSSQPLEGNGSTILDWPAAVSHVNNQLHKDPTLRSSIRKMIDEQRSHERNWFVFQPVRCFNLTG